MKFRKFKVGRTLRSSPFIPLHFSFSSWLIVASLSLWESTSVIGHFSRFSTEPSGGHLNLIRFTTSTLTTRDGLNQTIIINGLTVRPSTPGIFILITGLHASLLLADRVPSFTYPPKPFNKFNNTLIGDDSSSKGTLLMPLSLRACY